MNIAASLMTMRAGIRRHPGTADAFGGPSEPLVNDFQADGVPCYVWVTQKRELMDVPQGGVEEIKGLFRFDADISHTDEIYEVKDRRGRDVIGGGTLFVDSVTERTNGANPSHKEVVLRRQKA